MLEARGVTAPAVGIGGVTAIFTIVNAVLPRPLPFREPRRLRPRPAPRIARAFAYHTFAGLDAGGGTGAPPCE